MKARIWVIGMDVDDVGTKAEVYATEEAYHARLKEILKEQNDVDVPDDITDVAAYFADVMNEDVDGQRLSYLNTYDFYDREIEIPEPKPAPKPYRRPVCRSCGSSDVRVDAWATWDETNQKWEVSSTFDHAHCESCGGETSIEWQTAKMVKISVSELVYYEASMPVFDGEDPNELAESFWTEHGDPVADFSYVETREISCGS